MRSFRLLWAIILLVGWVYSFCMITFGVPIIVWMFVLSFGMLSLSTCCFILLAFSEVPKEKSKNV